MKNLKKRIQLVPALFGASAILLGATLQSQDFLEEESHLKAFGPTEPDFALSVMEADRAQRTNPAPRARASLSKKSPLEIEKEILKSLESDNSEIRLQGMRDFVVYQLENPAASTGIAETAAMDPYLAARAVAQIGPQAKVALPALIRNLEAIEVKKTNENFRSLSIENLRDRVYHYQRMEEMIATAAAIGSLGESAKAAAPALVRVRSNLRADVRQKMVNHPHLQHALDTIQWALTRIVKQEKSS